MAITTNDNSDHNSVIIFRLEEPQGQSDRSGRRFVPSKALYFLPSALLSAAHEQAGCSQYGETG